MATKMTLPPLGEGLKRFKDLVNGMGLTMAKTPERKPDEWVIVFQQDLSPEQRTQLQDGVVEILSGVKFEQV